MLMENHPNLHRQYVNRNGGIITLLINDFEIVKKSFRSRTERKKIMRKWTECFELMKTYGVVAIHIIHYDFNAGKDLNETPIKGDIALVKSAKRPLVYDKPRAIIPEKELVTFVRPKAEYSNMRLYDEV